MTSQQESRKVPATVRGGRRMSRELEDLNRQWAEYNELSHKLNAYYQIVRRQILVHQHPVSGLFPLFPTLRERVVASDPTLNPEQRRLANFAQVRDSVYCATVLWALAQGYRRIDSDEGRAYELSHSAIKCMRAVLLAWMTLTDRIERFKKQSVPENALPLLLNLETGEPFPPNSQEMQQFPEQLQMGMAAFYLITLVQMSASGLKIVQTSEEVALVQNLVFTIERAYRVPDYGVWARGSKYNTGSVELHASSISFCKAALESINGFDLFAEDSGASGVIYVDADAHSRNRIVLGHFLPRESSSKKVDAALMMAVGWPSFATHDAPLVSRTWANLQQLEGRYGYKRYPRDGFKNAAENPTRKHYLPAEMKNFENIENEWPIFFAMMIINKIFFDDWEGAKRYNMILQPLMSLQPVSRLAPELKLRHGSVSARTALAHSLSVQPSAAGGERPTTPIPGLAGGGQSLLQSSFSYSGEPVLPLLPQYYYVPSECLDEERARPGSQIRLPSCSRPGEEPCYLLGQAVYLISQLLLDKVVSPQEIDVISRHKTPIDRPRLLTRNSCFVIPLQPQGKPLDQAVQVLLIAESQPLQQLLSTYAIQTQTPTQAEPVIICPPSELVRVHDTLGVCPAIGLSGRPSRPFGLLGTSKFYRVGRQLLLCYPLLYELDDFYLSQDLTAVIQDAKADLAFLAQRWRLHGRPTYCILIREDMLRSTKLREFINFLAELRSGCIEGGIHVVLGRTQNFLSTGCVENLEFLNNQSFGVDGLSRVTDVDLGFHRFEEREPTVMYRSLRDLSLIEEITDADDDFIPINLDSRASSEIVELLRHSKGVRAQAEMLAVLARRQGLTYRVSTFEAQQPPSSHRSTDERGGLHRAAFSLMNGPLDGPSGERSEGHSFYMQPHHYEERFTTVEARLAQLGRRAGFLEKWAVVRLCSGLLHRLANSLAPELSAILVQGKILTLGVVNSSPEAAAHQILIGQKPLPPPSEVTVSKPLMPTEIGNIVYTHVAPYDIHQAVIQQELILTIGHFITIEPLLFHGMRRIRLGWLIEAMKLELAFRRFEERERQEQPAPAESTSQPGSSSPATPRRSLSQEFYDLSPSAIRGLLRDTLEASPNSYRSPLWTRLLEGALNRVPSDFYLRLYLLLERAPGGVRCWSYTLPQQPTLGDMEPDDLDFQLLVDQELLGCIPSAAYRQIIVECIQATGHILHRFPELRLSSKSGAISLDNIIASAIRMFQQEEFRKIVNNETNDIGEEKTARRSRHRADSVFSDRVLESLHIRREGLAVSGLNAWTGAMLDSPTPSSHTSPSGSPYETLRATRIAIGGEELDYELIEAFFDLPAIVKRPLHETESTSSETSTAAAVSILSSHARQFVRCSGTAVYLSRSALQYLLSNSEFCLPANPVAAASASILTRKKHYSSGGSHASSASSSGGSSAGDTLDSADPTSIHANLDLQDLDVLFNSSQTSNSCPIS